MFAALSARLLSDPVNERDVVVLDENCHAVGAQVQVQCLARRVRPELAAVIFDERSRSLWCQSE